MGDRDMLYWVAPFCAVVFMLVLGGCGDAASCWNHIKSRATSCEQMRLDEAERNKQERDR